MVPGRLLRLLRHLGRPAAPGAGAPAAPRRLVGSSALPPLDTTPTWGGAGVHGIPQGRRWDCVVLVPAAGPAGCDRLRFVVLVDGAVVAEEGPALGLEPLIEAVRGELPGPFRAEAVLREPGLWAVAANAVEIVVLPASTPGSHIVLSLQDGQRVLCVDDMPDFTPLPAVESLAAGLGPAWVVQAHRLAGDAWEARAEPL